MDLNIDYFKKNFFNNYIFALCILFTCSVIIILNNKRKKTLFLNIIKDYTFLILASLSALFSIYIFSIKKKDNSTLLLKRATKHALIAFVIAICAALELKLSAFWFTWIISYYLII